jgi:hypothetical protein
MNVIQKTKKNLNCIHPAYNACVFQDLGVVESLLHRSGSFIGMSCSKYMMFLRLGFNKADDDSFFNNTSGLLLQGYIDSADFLGNRCFVFYRVINIERVISPLLFIPDEEGRQIVSTKIS